MTPQPPPSQRPPAPETPGGLEALLHDLSLHRDSAELRHLVDLCRRSARVRAWLFGTFANNEPAQRAFLFFLQNSDTDAHPPWSHRLSTEIRSIPAPPPPGRGPHGGLSEPEIIARIKTLQAPGLDVTTLLLVRFWTRFSGQPLHSVPIALWRSTLTHWSAIVADPEGRQAQGLMRAIRLIHGTWKHAAGEPDFGYSNSWKIHILLHILDHPRPAYRLRDLRISLPQKYRNVDRNELLRFCQKTGIRRDARPGRPRANRALLSAPRRAASP